jgi:hypothetical protein
MKRFSYRINGLTITVYTKLVTVVVEDNLCVK